MSQSVGHSGSSDTRSLCADLSQLVAWVHSHCTICDQIPALEMAHNAAWPSKENSLVWMCGAGHAYHWQCGQLRIRNREGNEAVARRRRSVFSEASSREANLDEKRFRMTPSSKRAKADAVSAGSCSRSPGVTQQKDNTVYRTRDEPPARENKKNSKSTNSCFAEGRHLSISGGEVKTDRCKVKPESNEDLLVIIDEEQGVSDEDDQGNRIKQNSLSESPTKGVTAEVDLQMHRDQKVAFNMPTVTQISCFAPTGALPSPVSDQESPRLTPPNPETSRARNSSGSVKLEECVKAVPISNTEAKAQLEPPTSVAFFEFEATLDEQQPLQLSPPERGTPGVGMRGNVTENPVGESEPSCSGHTAHPAASQSSDQPPAASDENVIKKLKKKKRGAGYIQIFKDWLVSHCPSEAREIYELPPEDLNGYLVSFYTSAKRPNGTDFSCSSLRFLQGSIERYLKDHNYEYSVIRGWEFRASQEALKLKRQHLSQKEKEGEWSTLANLTDEDVESLREKGLLSKMQPQGLLHLMFITIIRGFGASTHTRSRNLYWGQLVLKKEGELEYLEWRDELSAEVNPGEPRRRLLARPDGAGDCPVTNYKDYTRRRPQDMLHDYDPLYLTPRPLCSMWDQVWYCKKSLSRAKMEKILKVITQKVKGPVKKSNK